MKVSLYKDGSMVVEHSGEQMELNLKVSVEGRRIWGLRLLTFSDGSHGFLRNEGYF